MQNVLFCPRCKNIESEDAACCSRCGSHLVKNPVNAGLDDSEIRRWRSDPAYRTKFVLWTLFIFGAGFGAGWLLLKLFKPQLFNR